MHVPCQGAEQPGNGQFEQLLAIEPRSAAGNDCWQGKMGGGAASGGITKAREWDCRWSSIGGHRWGVLASDGPGRSSSVCMIVATRFSMRIGSDCGSPPSRVDWPMTWPIFRPPPASKQRREVAPVVAAAVLVDAAACGPSRRRRPAGSCRDRPRASHVLEERRHGVVERRAHVAHALVDGGVVDVGVHVPDEVRRHGDEAAAAPRTAGGPAAAACPATWRYRRSCCSCSTCG